MQYVNASGREHYKKTDYVVKKYVKRTKPMSHGQALHIAKMRPNLTVNQIAAVANRPKRAIRCLLNDNGLKVNQNRRLTRDEKDNAAWSVDIKAQAMLRRPMSEWSNILEVLK